MAQSKIAIIRSATIAVAALTCIITFSKSDVGTANAVPAHRSFQNAHQAAAHQAATRIDIAGRQQMLSQRMAKATCLIATGIDSHSYKVQLRDAYRLFKTSETALRHGDAALQLGPEMNPEVLVSLLRTDSSWADYETHVEDALARRRVSLTEIVAMDQDGQRYLTVAGEATEEIAVSYGTAAPQAIPNLIVSAAGQQRTLSQKIIKDICLMRHVETPQLYATQVRIAAKMFDRTLATVQMGHPRLGISAAESPDITEQFQHIDALWALMKEVIVGTSPEARLSDKELSDLSLKAEEMLEMLDHLVALIQHQS